MHPSCFHDPSPLKEALEMYLHPSKGFIKKQASEATAFQPVLLSLFWMNCALRSRHVLAKKRKVLKNYQNIMARWSKNPVKATTTFTRHQVDDLVQKYVLEDDYPVENMLLRDAVEDMTDNFLQTIDILVPILPIQLTQGMLLFASAFLLLYIFKDTLLQKRHKKK